MSHQLISRNPDLKRLRDLGYAVEVIDGYLMLRGIPYVTAGKQIAYGTLISALKLAGDQTVKPVEHVMKFDGEYPCFADGRPIEQIRLGVEALEIAPGVVSRVTFSAKPQNPSLMYDDYFHKMMVYEAILSGPAQQIDTNVTGQTYPLVVEDEETSVFNYMDTASSRADIVAVSRKLELRKIIIAGLGGTGSYVLDLVAKTPAREIHAYDGDRYLQHNAFRSPGAPSSDELAAQPFKVDHFAAQYSKMHRGIVAHPQFVDATNVDEFRDADFVFICMDVGSAKRFLVTKLEEFGVPFVDVGMGVYLADDKLGGIVRTTLSTPEQRNHVWEKKRIPFTDGGGLNEYDKNIQIAALNSLNAALAVIKWQKYFGVIADMTHEHDSLYAITRNDITNQDRA